MWHQHISSVLYYCSIYYECGTKFGLAVFNQFCFSLKKKYPFVKESVEIYFIFRYIFILEDSKHLNY